MAAYLYIVGNAGCGKSALTSAFRNWMQTYGYDVVTVNLDPGVEWLPYAPDVDVREWINLDDVMREYGVGPNGAQIVAADLLALKIGEVKEALDEFVTEYYLIDTPGQMELFTLRSSSHVVVETLGKESAVLAYLFDPALAKTPQGFIALVLQSLSAQFRLDLPTVCALSKVDLLGEEERERILTWSGDPNALYDELIAQGSLTANLNVELFRALEVMDAFSRLIPTSAETGEGIADLYNEVQQVLYGGEDLSSD
ncbi:MAG: GTPase [Euryarchaeota archaeon]|nr:GTPase [Euryarchaeota archaeon]